METVAEQNARLMHLAATKAKTNGHKPMVVTGVLGELEEEELALAHIVDWATFWSGDKVDEDWLAQPLIPRGRAIALYAPAKAGKSSVVLAIVAALATGRTIFKRWRCEPTSILYLDYEMTEADVRDRLVELGYGPDDDLTNLHYALLPSLPPLDTPAGAGALLEIVEAVDAQLVVVDTFTRAVEGKENDADTVRAFYRFTGRTLKAAGRTVLRTDHAGKDADRGQRGTSGKADDVDVVWSLTRTEHGVNIKRTHSRISWVPDVVNLSRAETDSGGINWTVAEETYPDGTKEVAELLDALDVTVNASSRQAQQALKEAGTGRRRALVVAAQRWRQTALLGRFGAVDNPGNHPRNQVPGEIGDQPSEPPAKDQVNHPWNQAEPVSESNRLSLPVTDKEPVETGTTSGTFDDPDIDPIFGTPRSDQ